MSPVKTFWRTALVGAWFLAGACAHGPRAAGRAGAGYSEAGMIRELNGLRDDLCARYGFRNATPRINLGPCGRFARDFRERWNATFAQPVTIVFVMANSDPSNCYHVLLKLPGGAYYDGGNGVMTPDFLSGLYPDAHVAEMERFDHELLERRSYGLGRAYPECPNYSDEFTRRAIERHLSQLKRSGPTGARSGWRGRLAMLARELDDF